METYFFKSAACLAVLLLFYKFLLEKENMHVFKRFYLLLSVISAVLIPFITFTTYVEPTSGSLSQLLISQETAYGVVSTNYLSFSLLVIYVAGIIFFSVKFIRNLNILFLKIRTNPKVKRNDITNVLLSEKIHPHTFFTYIFFNKEKYLLNQIPRDVRVHEEAHARQKHSIDVIFVELLQIIFWVNPLIFLLKDYIKLNHEFLADRAVIQQGYRTAAYQQTLLSFSSGDLHSDLVNPINYSSIKKRFTVMKTQTSRKSIWARSLLILPLLALLLFSFSTKETLHRSSNLLTSEIEIENSNVLELSIDRTGKVFMDNNREMSTDDIGKLKKDKYKTASITSFTGEATPEIQELFPVLRSIGIGAITLCSSKSSSKGVPQKMATPEEVAEYNRLVKYYNKMSKDERVVRQEDANKIMAILSKMSPEQKKNAEKINFDVPPPPPPAPVSVPEAPEKNEVTPPSPPPVNDRGFPATPVPPAPPATADKVLPPPPPPVRVNGSQTPPPPPPSPIESVKEWVEEGAAFFYNGKSVSSKEALEIVQKNNGKNLSVRVEEKNSKKTVRLSDKL